VKNYASNQCENVDEVVLKQCQISIGPHQIAYDITNLCNLRCLHCYNRSGENHVVKNELSDDEVIALMNDIAEIKPKNVCFCGGEPLIRKEILLKAASVLKENHPGGCISMVTNGYFMTYDLAVNLLENGITRFQVSLDGATPKTHETLRQKEGSYEKAIHALQSLRKAEAEDIDVAFCPNAFNINEFAEVYSICCDIGINSLRVQPLMLLGRAIQHTDQLVPTPSQYRSLIKTINRIKEKNSTVNIEWGDPVDHLIRYRTSAVRNFASFISIKANGFIDASPYIPITVGNVRKHSLKDYWRAGLGQVWQLPQIEHLAQDIKSVADFNKQNQSYPKVWYDPDIELDIIDDNVFTL